MGEWGKKKAGTFYHRFECSEVVLEDSRDDSRPQWFLHDQVRNLLNDGRGLKPHFDLCDGDRGPSPRLGLWFGQKV